MKKKSDENPTWSRDDFKRAWPASEVVGTRVASLLVKPSSV
jgi:hypothetical protein